MKIEIATLFPEMCEAVLGESIVGRARKAGKIEVSCRQIREYTQDKHRRVDDTPYGGGMGMVMQCEPIYNCYNAVCDELGTKPHTIYMSPKGKVLTEQRAVELSKMDNILIICGHYEGVDQRVLDLIVDEEISIGDYVVTGGEIPACIVIDAVSRLLDGVLASSECYEGESVASGILEYPQYTKPRVFRDREVPEILLSGDHAKIDRWRLEEAVKITRERRPEMLLMHPEIEESLKPKKKRKER
jgi:tRNA (guanine37-N1)-methyltransferase